MSKDVYGVDLDDHVLRDEGFPPSVSLYDVLRWEGRYSKDVVPGDEGIDVVNVVRGDDFEFSKDVRRVAVYMAIYKSPNSLIIDSSVRRLAEDVLYSDEFRLIQNSVSGRSGV